MTQSSSLQEVEPNFQAPECGLNLVTTSIKKDKVGVMFRREFRN